MNPAVLGRAVVMFVVTNIDDIVVLTVLFGQARDRGAEWRVVAGQYLGLVAILAACAVGAAGAGLLPANVVAYLGLVPLALGVRAGWQVWSDRQSPGRAQPAEALPPATTIGMLGVAAITFANGGDNIGVYLPVFANATAAGVASYCLVFLVMAALWCALGRFLATRRPIALALSRWGHVLLPVVLVGIGGLILVEGGAFGL